MNSKLVDQYAKEQIKFKKISAVANYRNINDIIQDNYMASKSREFIFFGRSNVGKSSLINHLMQKGTFTNITPTKKDKFSAF